MKANSPSLVLSIFSFFGGFLSILFLIGLLLLLNFFDSSWNILGLSLSGLLVSFGFLYWGQKNGKLQTFNSFFLALYYVSKTFILFAAYSLAPDFFSLFLLSSAVLEGIGLFLLTEPAIQVLSSLGFLGFFSQFLWQEHFYSLYSLMGYFSLVLSFYFFKAKPGNQTQYLRFLSFAIGSLTFLSMGLFDYEEISKLNSSPVLVTLLGFFLYLTTLDLLSLSFKHKFSLFFGIAILLFSFGNSHSPAILVTTFLILASFFRKEILLRSFSYLSFFVLICEFYYSWKISLLEKSIYLFLTGVLLFAVSFLLSWALINEKERSI